MTTRDRLVVCGLVAIAAVVALWLGVVSPKRHDAAKLGAAVTAQKTLLATAQQHLAQGRAAEGSYTANLKVVKQLYKAVPANSGVPKLLVALDKTSHHKRIDFAVINVSTTAPVAATTPIAGGVPAAPSVLTPISFTFTFDGGYIALQHFINSIDSYTLVKGNSVIAHGRLLSIKSVSLTPQSGAAQASVTATAYTQPPATLGATTPTTASPTPTS